MKLSTPSASPDFLLQAQSPLRLPSELRLTPEQFSVVCAENRDAMLELVADGHMTAMTPTGSETGSQSAELLFQLKLFAQGQGQGKWKVFDSSTGFLLPDGSVLSPDASLVALERWQALTPDQRRGFAPLCPDLVVELATPSDEGPRGLSALRQKMATYQVNGARLGWLLIPHAEAVEVWSACLEPQYLQQIDGLEAGPEFPRLRLQLPAIWAG